MPTLSVVFHSGSGHTAHAAEAIAAGARSVPGLAVNLLRITPDQITASRWNDPDVLAALDASDAIIFGCPTYMGGPSAQFKAFLDATGDRWYTQAWKDKLAAGFTNSGGLSGDKQGTLEALFTTAMQHSMIWVSQGLMVSGSGDTQLNRLGSWSGAMTQSVGQDPTPQPADLHNARAFGARVAAAALRWAKGAAHSV